MGRGRNCQLICRHADQFRPTCEQRRARIASIMSRSQIVPSQRSGGGVCRSERTTERKGALHARDFCCIILTINKEHMHSTCSANVPSLIIQPFTLHNVTLLQSCHCVLKKMCVCVYYVTSAEALSAVCVYCCVRNTVSPSALKKRKE